MVASYNNGIIITGLIFFAESGEPREVPVRITTNPEPIKVNFIHFITSLLLNYTLKF
jgi:hypothetical protein